MKSSIAKTVDINHVHFYTSLPFSHSPEIFLDNKPLSSTVDMLVFQGIVGERETSVEVLLSCEWIELVGGWEDLLSCFSTAQLHPAANLALIKYEKKTNKAR